MFLFIVLPVIGLAQFVASLTLPVFHKPCLLILTLGIIDIIVGICVWRYADSYIQREVADPYRDTYYRSQRPVKEKVARMQPGCHGLLLALTYVSLGLWIIGLQIIAHYHGK